MKKSRLILTPLCAFTLSILSFVLFLSLYGVLGYGNYTILRGDLYVQYIDFIHLFLNVLKGKEDFWYTFSQYYGSPSILMYAYYAFSPLNILYLIESISIPTMTIIIIAIKLGLCGAFFSLFARTCLKSSGKAAVFFAICYAMNSFNITLHFNIIWLESAYLLPLIILLLYRLNKTGKFIALIPAFTLLFLSNFYMAFISGLFIAAVYTVMVVISPIKSKEAFKHIIGTTFRFTISVILAAGICAAILFPCAKFLISHMAADNNEFTPLSASVFDILNSMMVGVMPDIDNRTPFLYCGIPVLLFTIHYFMQKSIPLRERILNAVLLAVCFLSILYLPVFMLSHAFDYPNFYFFRNSAFICFLLCSLACRCFNCTKGCLSPRSLWISITLLICLYSFMIKFWPFYSQPGDVTNSSTEMAVNILFLTLWGIIISPHPRIRSIKPVLKTILCCLCFSLLILELSVNGWISFKHADFSPISENEYNNWYQAEKNILDQIPEDDDQLYRISMYGDNNYNSSALFGYSGFNTFSSSDQYPLRNALFDLGISVSNRNITEIGYTDLTYMLFNKAYTGKMQRVAEGSEERNSELEEFPYRLSIAYTVTEDILNYSPGTDPFENQEKLAKALSGKDYKFFDYIDIKDIALSRYNAKVVELDDNMLFSKASNYFPTSGIYFSVPKDAKHPFYGCFRQDVPTSTTVAPYLLGSDECFAESYTLSQGCITKGGHVNDEFSPDTDNIVIFFNETSLHDYSCTETYFARFDDSALPALHSELSRGILILDDWSSSHLKGHVSSDENHPILFTSIPWDEGWEAYIDGKPAICDSLINGAFLSLRLSPGIHDIELKYIAPGSKTGLIISLISVSLTVILVCLSYIKTLRSNTPCPNTIA